VGSTFEDNFAAASTEIAEHFGQSGGATYTSRAGAPTALTEPQFHHAQMQGERGPRGETLHAMAYATVKTAELAAVELYATYTEASGEVWAIIGRQAVANAWRLTLAQFEPFTRGAPEGHRIQ